MHLLSSVRLITAVVVAAALLPAVPAAAQTARDLAPPQLVSFDVTPRTVDVSDGDARVVVTARWTDPSGIEDAGPQLVTFSSTTTPESYSAFLSRVADTATSATYRGTFTMPQAATPGGWPVSLSGARDTRGNAGFADLVSFPPLVLQSSAPARAPVLPALAVDRTVLDVGASLRLTVSGRVGAAVELYGNGRSIRTTTMPSGGSVTWQLHPGLRTTFHATVDSRPTENALVLVRRSVGIGVRQAAETYVLSGRIETPQAGVQVTVARLDPTTGRVTGVAFTRTDAAGRYAVRTALPVGRAGYDALTSATPMLLAGRSRLYGLVVPRRS